MASQHNPSALGLRERKRRATRVRIQKAGIRLFSKNGYDATTLDDIAAAADISRRTIFYYFKSKEDILLSLRESADEGIAPAMRAVPQDRRPLEAAREALTSVCSKYSTDDLLVVDRLMRASHVVQARKQSFYLQREQALLAALKERWPQQKREAALRLVAMVSVSAFRLALDNFNLEGGRQPLAALLHEAFELLQRELSEN